jgi:hypothetical protein
LAAADSGIVGDPGGRLPGLSRFFPKGPMGKLRLPGWMCSPSPGPKEAGKEVEILLISKQFSFGKNSQLDKGTHLGSLPCNFSRR